MRSQSRLLLLAVLVALAGVMPAAQTDRRLPTAPTQTPAVERRVALVIGNDAYTDRPLANAVNDARSLAAMLRELRFDVTEVINSTRPQLDRAIDGFVGSLRANDVALVFYSGHGIQLSGENYIVPIGFSAADEAEARYEGYSASRIHDRITQQNVRLAILILDACRDNPYLTSRSAGGGLAAMGSGRGSFIAFATAPGETASDNPTGRNGLFTTALLAALREPGLGLDAVFSRTRQRVAEASNRGQVPWTTSSVVGDFVFRPLAAAPAVSAGTSPSSDDLTLRAELALWESIDDSTNPALFEDYLRQFPNGRFRVVAQTRLAELRKPAASTPPAGRPGSVTPSLADPTAAEVPSVDAVARRWAYARVEGGADQTSTKAPLQQLARDLGIGLLFDVASSGLVFASPELDVSTEATRRLGRASGPDRRPDLRALERVAYLNIQRVASESTRGKALAAQVQSLNQRKVDELNALNKRLQQARGVASETVIRQLERDIEQFTKDAQAEVQGLQKELQDKFQAALAPVIKQLCGDAGIQALLSAADSGLVYADDSLDVTGPAITRLDMSSTGRTAPPPVSIPRLRGAAFLNIQRVASESKMGKALAAQVQGLNQRKVDELNALNRRIQQARGVASETTIKQMEGEIEQFTKDAQAEVQGLQKELQDKFQNALTPLLRQFATEQGIQLILSEADSGILAADASLDITVAIIRRLDAR